MLGRYIIIDFDRYMLCFSVHCIRLCVVFFIGYLVFSAYFLCTLLCGFEIVQYIPLFVVCWGLLRVTLKHLSLQNKITDVVSHHHSRRLLKMDILMFETC